MRVTIAELRRIICEGLSGSPAPKNLGGSQPEEQYEGDLADDPALKKKSVLVPDDVKKPIGKYLKAMGLTGSRKKRSRSV